MTCYPLFLLLWKGRIVVGWVSLLVALPWHFLHLPLPSRRFRYPVVVLPAGRCLFSSHLVSARVTFSLFLQLFSSCENTWLLLDFERLFLSSIRFEGESRCWPIRGLTSVRLPWKCCKRILLMLKVNTSHFGRSWRSCGGSLPALGWFSLFVHRSEGDKALTFA